MKNLAPALVLLAACAAPSARAPKAEPFAPLPFAFDLKAPADAPFVVVRFPLDDKPPTDAALDAARRFVAPDSWSRGALYIDGTDLVIRNTADACDRVRDLLAALRKAGDRIHTISARVLRIEPSQLSDLSFLDLHDGTLAGRFDRTVLADLFATWTRDGAQACAAPRLSIFAGQPGNIVISTQTAYVQGYERDGFRDPVIGIFQEGLSLSLLAAPNGDRDGETALALSLEVSHMLERAPDLLSVRLDDRVFQFPAAATSRVGGRFALGRVQSLLLVTRNPDRSDSRRPLMVIAIDVD